MTSKITMTARYVHSIILPALVFVAGACDSPSEPGRVMIDEQVWGGSELSLSQVESGPDTIFHLGDRPLPIIASSAGGVTLKVPTDVNGMMDLTRHGSYNEQYGRIDVIGFTDSIFHPHIWYGNPLRWRQTGPASFVANRLHTYSMSEYEMVSGAVTTLHDGMCCFKTPGLTSDPDVLLFSSDSVEEWRMRPVRELVAKHPPVAGSTQTILMNDSVRIELSQKKVRVTVGDRNGYVAFQDLVADGYLSPRGDRVAMRGFRPAQFGGGVAAIDGIPVIGESGDSAFFIRDVEFAFGVAFSPTGDTLYIAGSPTREDTTTRVIAYNATTGAIHRLLDYRGYMPLDMIIDRTGRWLLIAMMTGYWGSRDGGGAHVLIIDRGTMMVAGHMEAPMDWVCSVCDVTITDGDDGIFLAINSRDGGMVVFRFRALSDID